MNPVLDSTHSGTSYLVKITGRINPNLWNKEKIESHLTRKITSISDDMKVNLESVTLVKETELEVRLRVGDTSHQKSFVWGKINTWMLSKEYGDLDKDNGFDVRSEVKEVSREYSKKESY